MVTSGGLLTWTGAYFTQFFYEPLLGAGLLCLLWAFLIWLLRKTFRIPDHWLFLSLIPVACLLINIVDLGYWIFYMKLRGHIFDATIGTVVAVGLTWLYGKMPRKYSLSTVFIVVTACVAYPLFGFYGLLAVALMGISGRRLADGLASVVTIVAVPLVCYYMLYHETNIVNIYWTALPVFAMHGERFFVYNLPYIVLVVSIVLMAIHKPSYEVTKRPVLWGRVCMLILALAVALFWNKDDNFHRELAMSRSIGEQQWEDVLTTARSVKGEPTRAICMMKNLALFRLGRMEDDMFKYPEGARRPAAPFSVRLVHTQGKMLYLQYGIPNYCYRWCMEDAVEYGWSVTNLKLMVKCSLLNGEMIAAQRYINMLKKTDFHPDWARHYEAYIHQPSLIADDPELRPILPLLRNDNFITADQSQLELFLVEHILSTAGTTPEQQQLARQTMKYYRNNRHQLVEQ